LEVGIVNDELANDRTFLAWLRTGIACFGLGFVVAKVALIINPSRKSVPYRELYTGTGVLIVVGGAALVAAGCWQHRQVLRALRSDATEPLPQWPFTMTAVAIVGSLALSLLIVIST
jgi:putative membrane protein